MKTKLAVLLVFSLLLGCFLPAGSALAAGGVNARLYNVYGDGMLFQQKANAVFAGEAPDGAVISAQLYNSAGRMAASGADAAKNGTFTVSFPAPAGSYKTYTVRLFANGTEFAVLNDVVFGELWLAAGQSNMQYQLNMTAQGKEMEAAGKTGSKDLHVLMLPTPMEDGAFKTRYLPQTDVEGCSWFTADDPQVYGMSAVAYFFADSLQKSLKMPVGVLNAPLGGSAVASWLSRSAIDGNAAVKRHLTETGTYYDEARWSDPDRSILLDMTNLYNINIAPILHFRPQGVIWYQGCTDLMLGRSVQYYNDLFTLMQDSYTADFGYTGGRMPFIYCQLACFDYGGGPYQLPAFNDVFTTMAKEAPASRGEVAIYDLSLAFNEMGSIHPMTKKPIGDRMAQLAEGLVYGAALPTSAAACVKAEAKADGVYLTFNNVGDGLRFGGGTPRGFAVCGKDGVMYEAQAEITAKDTVRVYNDAVAAPVAATYAAGAWSESANLFSTCGGELYQPAAPYITDDPAVTHLYADVAWMHCESLTAFESGEGYTDAFKTSACSVSVSADAAEGDGALRIVSTLPAFSVSPVMSAKEKLKTVVFDNVDPDWSDYGVMRLQLKNNGDKAVRLGKIKLYTGAATYYVPVCTATNAAGVTVPADGAWHTFTFDLTRLMPMGAAGIIKTNDKLTEVKNVTVCFEGAKADILMDGVCVLPAGETAAEPEQTGCTAAFTGWLAYLRAMLQDVIESLRVLFAAQ